ncbi:MAG: response regulator, partial [Deltaproteobacteria bacterium]|nr:response regulator [Deltaproteobacteria bacterium]
VLGRGLNEAGFEVLEASEGGEALRKCREHAISVVLLDIFMPGKEGIETLREMRAEFPGLKVVAMSGGGSYPFFDVLSAAKRLGAEEVFQKPVSLAHLLSTLRRLTGDAATQEAVTAPGS